MSTTTSPAKEQECPHCSDGHETFRYFKGTYKFDVDLARQIVADGREPVELELEDVRYSVDMCRIYPQHVRHVNPEYPGIIAHVWAPTSDDEGVAGHVLIDGHHRAARCLEMNRPYFVYLLSEEESEAVLTRGPRRESLHAASSAAASLSPLGCG